MTVVAIDGPAGSGKSTIAAALAEHLGLAHVDTGAYYRAAALAVLRSGAGLDDPEGMLAAVRDVAITRRRGRTCLDGADVEAEIRGADVTRAVSLVARVPEIRRHLVAQQQATVPAGGAVVEGRDAATVVVPHADMKVWLTASPQERARRRAAETGDADEAAVARHVEDIRRRDDLDAAQMQRAPDALEIDTTGRSVADIVAELAARLAPARRA